MELNLRIKKRCTNVQHLECTNEISLYVFDAYEDTIQL